MIRYTIVDDDDEFLEYCFYFKYPVPIFSLVFYFTINHGFIVLILTCIFQLIIVKIFFLYTFYLHLLAVCRTKRMIVDVIACQAGDDLTQVLDLPSSDNQVSCADLNQWTFFWWFLY